MAPWGRRKSWEKKHDASGVSASAEAGRQLLRSALGDDAQAEAAAAKAFTGRYTQQVVRQAITELGQRRSIKVRLVHQDLTGSMASLCDALAESTSAQFFSITGSVCGTCRGIPAGFGGFLPARASCTDQAAGVPAHAKRSVPTVSAESPYPVTVNPSATWQ